MNGLSHASGQSFRGPRVQNVEPSMVDPAAYPCRRRIRSAEILDLRALGRVVRGLRFVDGRRVVRSTDLGFLAQVPITTLWRIETGIRRTRRSTLQRIAKAASRLNPSAGTQDEIFGQLIEAAGDALAPPSKYQYRVNRRRMRRYRRSNANPYLRKLSGRIPDTEEK